MERYKASLLLEVLILIHVCADLNVALAHACPRSKNSRFPRDVVQTKIKARDNLTVFSL